jgi:hypothetical protein
MRANLTVESASPNPGPALNEFSACTLLAAARRIRRLADRVAGDH